MEDLCSVHIKSLGTGAQGKGHWKEPYVWCDSHGVIPPEVPLLKKTHKLSAMKKILYFCLQNFN